MARVAVSLIISLLVMVAIVSLDPVLWLPFIVALAIVGVLGAAGAAAESWKAQLQQRREEYERATSAARLITAMLTELRGVGAQVHDAVRQLGAALGEVAATSSHSIDALAVRYEDADLGLPAGAQAVPTVADPGFRGTLRKPQPFRFGGCRRRRH